MPNLTHSLYESPMRDRNLKKYGRLSGGQCICCFKPIKKAEFWLHMNTAWEALHSSVTDENCLSLTGHESQGCYEVGSECAEKMPKDFIHVII